MNKKLFVGNLPFVTTEEELKNLFGQHGNVVAVTIIYDKYTKKSKGFGFVEFETEDQAQAALQALDGQDLNGRNIAVKEALPMTDRRPTEGGAQM